MMNAMHNIVLLACSLTLCVHAAYKPGWTPPKCLAEKLRPSNVSIEVDNTYPGLYNPYTRQWQSKAHPVYRFHVNDRKNGSMVPLFIRGAGYSPIPPSKYTNVRPFDVFTAEYEYIWKRDLDKIRSMGANTIRVWSWDSFRDHSAFLDACYDMGLYVMVPFLWNPTDYPDISIAATMQQVLTDWKAFVYSVMNHPAVLAYLVGNELNTAYGAEREELFSLVNQMVRIRDDIDNARHPISLPLSDVSFVETYSNKFFQWSAIDFWSLQSYREPEYLKLPIQDYYYSYVQNMSNIGIPFKPLVMTEFGVDALPTIGPNASWPQGGGVPTQPSEDQMKQATGLCQMFNVMRDNVALDLSKYYANPPYEAMAMSHAGIVAGAIIMEWVDEWWKGQFGDVRAPLCPNRRTEVHTWCAHNVGVTSQPYYLHEEWLGLNSQIYDETEMTSCICPRRSYHSMTQAFQCGGNETCLNGTYNCFPDPTPFPHCQLQWCAYRRNVFLNPYISMVAPVVIIFLVLLGTAFYLKKKMERDQLALEGEKRLSRNSVTGEAGEFDAGVYQPEDAVTSIRAVKLKDSIAEAFLQYSNIGTVDRFHQQGDRRFCPYFRAAQERLFVQIWDKFLGFDVKTELQIVTAIRVIYEQLMEGYYLWLDRRPGTKDDRGAQEELSREAMLSHMALYSIIQTWAGTINHCPEKICEVMEFSLRFFEHSVPLKHGRERIDQIQDFHHGLVEIFRTYYLKVDEGEFTFEDVNTDAILFRAERLTTSGKRRIEEFWKNQSLPEDTEDEGPRKRQHDPTTVHTNTGADCLELELLPDPELKGVDEKSNKRHPFLEYHRQRNSEKTLLSLCAQCFFLHHKELVGKQWMDKKEAFPQKGGPLTLLFNYGYIIRYLLWQNLWATFFQPISIAAPMCVCTAVQIIALADSIWMLVSALLHFRVLGRFTKRITYELILYGGACSLVVLSNTFEHLVPVVSQKVDGDQQNVSNLFSMGYSINTFYVIGALVIAVFEELRLLISPTVPTYPIAARFTDKGVVIRTRIAFYSSLFIFSVAMLGAWFPNLTSDGTIMDMLNKIVDIKQFPNLMTLVWWIVFVLGSSGISYFCAQFFAGTVIDPVRKAASRRTGRKEAEYLVLNYLFWGMFVASNWMLAFYVLVPAVNNINFDICKCDSNIPSYDEAQRVMCSKSYTYTCDVAVVFTWLSAELISFVALYGIFEMLMLLFGLIRGKAKRVGSIKTWQDVRKNFTGIHARCMHRMSHSLLQEPSKQNEVWNHFVRALYDDCLLSDKERDRLLFNTEKRKEPDFNTKIRSEEAIRRIIYYLWSLESSLAHEENTQQNVHTTFRKNHRVRTMPTLTCVIPAYNETIIFDEEQLTRARAPGNPHLRITEIEYLAHTYPDEWDNFAERIKSVDGSWVVTPDNYSMDLLNSYLSAPGHPRLSEAVRFEVRWWATMRGQTLARTVQGLINWRQALVYLIRLEEEGISMEEAQRIVNRKWQVIVSHQTFNPKTDITKAPNCPHEEAMELCFRKLKFFDLVYNDDDNFQSVCRRLKPEVLIAEAASELKYTNTIEIKTKEKDGTEKVIERKMFNYFSKDCFETLSVQRVGKLKIGEGKAENQMHALQFVNGMVLQAMDMNQYATLENGFKVPYILSDFFNTPHRLSTNTAEAWDGESIIPQVRIVGFPEWAYTRSLSLVGELMGAAEWCFVTITHRVLDWPLRIRCHYGHPDFFDCFWVRNRGGQSKASQLVNTNEDIFAGYEMIGRGDRGSFVEFLEAQKGRETSFGGAFTFEAKLAMGGAQQTRSFDVYRLNRGLDVITRCNLFFSSLAFYVTNLLMAISINYYVLSIALYAVSGVTYHKLGLLEAVIAIPWLVQIGYALALPYLVELIIQRGFWAALGNFVKTLPPAVIFFIFHLRTKAYFFTQGLMIGKGGYAGTGRGFGLDRTGFTAMYKAYSESHYHEALLICAVLIIYGIYGLDPPGAYLLRCINIIMIVVSWMWAPILFNPAPTTQDLQNDAKEILDWATNTKAREPDVVDIGNRLKKIHFLRLRGLVENLEKECRDHLQGTELAQEHEARAASNLDGVESTSNFAGITGQFQQKLATQQAQQGTTEDFVPALRTVCSILAASKEKIKREVERLQTLVEPRANQTLDNIINEYWGTAEADSWTGWYQKAVVMMMWESEDQFFPGLVNLMIQKVYLHIEIYLPWIVLAWDQFHIDSVWFLIVITMSIAIGLMVDHGFSEHHEYTTVAKGTLVILLPLCGLFFHYSIMKFGQLVWSLILYLIIFTLLVRAFLGVINARYKYRYFGLRGNPYHLAFDAFEARTEKEKERIQISVKNRTQEMEKTNANEELRFMLFRERTRFISLSNLVRSVAPLVSAAVLIIGNVITVIIGGWITTLNFNGRVNEAWKKAYLRPSVTVSTDDKPDTKYEPLTRMREQQQDEVQMAQAAVHGTISASLQPAGARRNLRTNRNFLTSKALPVAGAGPQSNRTLMSVGSFMSHADREDEQGLGDRLLADRRQSDSHTLSLTNLASQPRHAMHFLNKYTDKEVQKRQSDMQTAGSGSAATAGPVPSRGSLLSTAPGK
jgi:hypothetical protein